MRRPPISWRWIRRAIVAALIAGFLFFRDALPSLDLERLIEDLSEGLGAWTYLLVGGLAFLETGAFVGLVAPGEFTVILGGAVAQQGAISLPQILGITWLAAFCGDSVSFLLGAKLGRGFLVRHGARVRITEERLRQVESYFARHGGKTILVGRFIGLVRALAPFIAGSSNMRYRNFAPYSILGTGLWATGLILAGYFAARSLDAVTQAVGTGLIVFGIVVGIVVAIVVATRYLRVPANRARIVGEMERRRALRPLLGLYRRLRPELAFLGRRLTPGGLGLELTSLLAGLSVGLYVLITYWTVLADDPGPTSGDDAAYDLFNDIRVGWLNDLAEAVTHLGDAGVALAVAGVAAIALAASRRRIEAASLVVGMLLAFLLVQGIKEWIDRPRPPDPLVDSSRSSFPSGHATYSTVYIWIVVTLAIRVVPRISGASAVIASGIALAALIGITRVYLRVHWLSDVTAGWALGLSSFAAVAIVALITSHIRHNHRRHERADQRSAGAGPGARD
ncbi:MAG TPA: bifunctional DedA family/phosphatase PAP2 family protein [Solirubrobacterales bacterium]|nr:bifunctional DedA family/phosphatase PAP2 family protein [Solirubrobacterales bacterium]